MPADIRDMLIILTPENTPHFQVIRGDSNSGARSIRRRTESRRRSSAMICRADSSSRQRSIGARAFAYHLSDSGRRCMLEFDRELRAPSIEVKPVKPRSNQVVTGLYFCNYRVCDIVTGNKLSTRSECEITDVRSRYFAECTLNVEIMGRG